MQKFLKNWIKVSKNMNLYEISYFKIYLICVSLFIATIFPIVLSLNIFFYLFLFIVFDIVTLILLIKKEWNFLKKIFWWKHKNYKVLKHFWITEFWFFKATMFSFWLLIAKVFPIFTQIHIWIYIIIIWLWIWYFVSSSINYKN